jgi:hypothetical protein
MKPVRRDLYSASEVARLSGATLRSVRYWALTGILQPTSDSDRAGTGTHRAFTREEIVVACVVRYFSDKGLQIGQLAPLSQTVRFIFFAPDAFPFLRAAIRDEQPIYLSITDSGTIKLSDDSTIKDESLKQFTEMTTAVPGFSAVLLNAVFAPLRTEWL